MRTFIDDIELDVIKSFRETRPTTLTSHPVEQGSDITDHAREESFTIVIEAVYSDISPRLKQNQINVVKSRLILLTGKEVTIKHKFSIYNNMSLQDISFSDTAETGNSIQFTATFKHIVRVAIKTTKRVATKKASAKKKAKTGDQVPKAATEPQKKRSILANLDDTTGQAMSKFLTGK